MPIRQTTHDTWYFNPTEYEKWIAQETQTTSNTAPEQDFSIITPNQKLIAEVYGLDYEFTSKTVFNL